MDSSKKNFTDTRISMLVAFNEGNDENFVDACSRFSLIYTDPLVAFLRRKYRHLKGKDSHRMAEDVVQDFLLDRVILKRQLSEFNNNYKGQNRKFRSFICCIVDRMFLDRLRKEKKIGQKIEDLPPTPNESCGPDEDAVFEYVLAANLLLQIFIVVKNDCYEKDQKDMWNVFRYRVIDPAIRGSRLKHEEIATKLGLKSARRSRNLLDSGIQKFKTLANRVIKNSALYPEFETRSAEELLQLISNPSIPNFDLSGALSQLVELAPDDGEVFLIETSDQLKRAAESWLSNRDDNSQDEKYVRWRKLLNQEVASYLKKEIDLETSDLSAYGIIKNSGLTVADVLFTETSEFNELEELRTTSRNLVGNSGKSESKMHLAIYTLVHASDIIYHRKCQSKNSEKQLRENIVKLLDRSWIDEQSKWQLNEAIKTLDQMIVTFPRKND